MSEHCALARSQTVSNSSKANLKEAVQSIWLEHTTKLRPEPRAHTERTLGTLGVETRETKKNQAILARSTRTPATAVLVGPEGSPGGAKDRQKVFGKF